MHILITISPIAASLTNTCIIPIAYSGCNNHVVRKFFVACLKLLFRNANRLYNVVKLVDFICDVCKSVYMCECDIRAQYVSPPRKFMPALRTPFVRLNLSLFLYFGFCPLFFFLNSSQSNLIIFYRVRIV